MLRSPLAAICTAVLLMAQDRPPEVKTSITITGQVAAEVPGDISVLDRGHLDALPGINLDDRLRALPGFSLLRRSSSVVAHPTTQGVSLRGIGSNGASRTLVLWDGVPLNDPFGGWIYWTRVPVEELDRIEVSPGSPSSVFGDRAMGGVISLFSRQSERKRLDAGFGTGAWGTADASLSYSDLHPRWAILAGGQGFRTDGYYIVPESLRGPVDRRAGVDYTSGYSRADFFDAASRLSLKVDTLAERRRNGTVLQNNSSSLGTASAHYERSSISLLAWHSREALRSSFSSVLATRAEERATFQQYAPSHATGGAALWQHRTASIVIRAGGDSVRNEGSSTDRLVPSGVRTGGGSIWTRGIFGQGEFSSGPIRVFAGLRGDNPGRGPKFASPSAGLTLSRGVLRGWVSVYRGFRAPTLNELYRQFQVGNVLTRANSQLGSERMTSVQTGASATRGRMQASITFYRNSLEGLITNVTLSSSPGSIVRQRQNAGAGLARGIEADLRRSWGPFAVHAGYMFADSRFATGLRISQVARHQGTGGMTWERGGTIVTAGVRALSAQFDDDLNSFLLPGYYALSAGIKRRIRSGLFVIAGLDNLLGREFLVALTPTPNTGAPRYWNLGLRWEAAARRGTK